MKFIWYNYPKGGVIFRIGEDVTVYNIKFAFGIMTKWRFIGYITFLPPREFNILEKLGVQNEPETYVGGSRRPEEG